MQVSVETTSELSRKMTVLLSEDTIQERISSRLKALAHEVKIDGFRPGKVPQSVIRKRFGPKVREEVLSELIQSSFNEAVRGNGLRPAGLPQIVAHRVGEGEGLEYEANFEIMPEFVTMPLETLEVTRYQSEVTDEDVEAMVERLRDQRKTWHPVERAAVDGDRVIISFEGHVGDQPFTNGKTQDFPVVIGSSQMIPGFEQQLVGTAAGAHLEFELPFPGDYPNDKLAGHVGRFTVDVSRVEESVLPEIDEEFAKFYGVADGNLATFRNDIRANMERELRRALLTRTKNSVMDEIYSKNPINIPTVLIRDEINNLMAPYRDAANERQQTLDETKLMEQLQPVARRRVGLALILGNIIDTYKLKADSARVRTTIEELAASYEEPDEVVRWYYAQPDRLREVENLVMEDRIVELVLEKARTNEQTISFQELMQQGATGAQHATQ